MTVEPDYAALGETASNLADEILRYGEALTGSEVYWNNGNGEIPAYLVTPIYLDANSDFPTPPEKQLISITTAGQDKTYYRGETLPSNKLTVTAYYDDGSESEVTSYCVYGPDTLAAGTVKVIVTYTERGVTATASATLTVEERTLVSIKVTRTPYKSHYVEGDYFDPDGMVIAAVYDKGGEAVVTGYEYEPRSTLFKANDKITITYEEGGLAKQTTQSITVYAKLVGIEIVTPAKKKAYVKGERFDRSGMKVIASYSDGTSKELWTGSLTIESGLIKFENGANRTQVRLAYRENGVDGTGDGYRL